LILDCLPIKPSFLRIVSENPTKKETLSTLRPMKNDLRVRYTQQVLKENLILLLGRKPIEKITVKELCEASSVNRTTFYAHYLDIFDLMSRMKEEMKAEILRHMESFFFSDSGRKQDAFAAFLRFLRKNSLLYLILIHEPGSRGLMQQMWQTTIEMYLHGKNQKESSPPPQKTYVLREKEFFLVYHVYGITAVIEAWLGKGALISEEELTDLIFNRLGAADSF